jgi:hypothetical protein
MFSQPDYRKTIRNLYGALIFLSGLLVAVCALLLVYALGDWQAPQAGVEARPPVVEAPVVDDEWDRVEDGVHVMTGLKVAEGFELVRANCTACHSGKLIAQNRATREGWQEMIRWMQATQGLWELGENEAAILDYLAANYAPEETGRRANLNIEEIEWYLLEEE